jgi:hypothetical protein
MSYLYVNLSTRTFIVEGDLDEDDLRVNTPGWSIVAIPEYEAVHNARRLLHAIRKAELLSGDRSNDRIQSVRLLRHFFDIGIRQAHALLQLLEGEATPADAPHRLNGDASNSPGRRPSATSS